MSVHLVEMAAEIQLSPALKLALLCFADSGSADGRIARPGLDNLMRWTGLKKSRALEVVKHLQELQLLAAHRPAHRGQRAEYVVFPNGCCERHGRSPAVVLRAVAAAGEPLTCTDEKGSAGPDPFSAGSISTGSAGPDPISSNGSDPVDGKGPIFDPERVRSSRSKREPSKYYLPEPELPSGTDHQPLPPRDRSEFSIDFAAVDRPLVGRQVQPSGFALGCRHCDAGYVCDDDGLPVARCQHCHPAHRSRGATA